MIFFIVLAIILNFTFGLLVLLKNTKKKEFVLFSLLSFSAAIWCFNNLMTGTNFEPEFWLKGAYAWGGMVITFGLIWTFYITKDKHFKQISIIFLLLSILFFISSYIEGIIIKNVQDVYLGRYDGETGPIFIPYTIYFFGVFAFMISKLVIEIKRNTGIERTRLIFVLPGITLHALTSIIVSFLLPILGIFQFMTLDSPSSLFFVSFIAYTIIKHRLMGLKFLFSRLFSFLLISIFAYIFFYLVSIVELRLWTSIFDIRSLTFGMIFAFIYTLALIPFINKIQETGDKFFFKGKNPQKRIKDILVDLNNAIELNDVYRIITREFNYIFEMKKSDIRILIFENIKIKNSSVISKTASYNYLKIADDNLILNNIRIFQQILVEEEMDESKDPELINEMQKFKVKIILPLITKKKLLGLIMMGEKKSKEAYSKEDFDFLEIIKAQATSAIDNALLYRKVKNFSRTLKRRVNEQTHELIDKNKHLKQLLKIRGEFLNIASHQLRTPVTVIKGMSDMIVRGTVPKGKENEFLIGISNKAQKLADIIHDILSASEMDNNEFNLKLDKINITDLVNDVIKDKETNVHEKKLKFKTIIPTKSLFAIANYRYFSQAIGNIINNSIRYTDKGSITLELTENQNDIIIRIKDTGIGINKKDIPTLFDKFVRADNAVKHYTDGSGLGLFIVQKTLKAHPGGNVYVESSEIGKGSTFVITLKKFEEGMEKIYKTSNSSNKTIG